MKLKLDENLSRHLQPELAGLGHDVETVAGEGLLACPDTAIGTAAKAEGRMLFTLDLDFGVLRKYPRGSHPGIVLFRPATCGPLAVNAFVVAFARRTGLTALAGCLVVVEPRCTRIRWPPPQRG